MVTAKRLVIKEILNHSSNSRKMVNKSEIKTLKKRAVIKIDPHRINYPSNKWIGYVVATFLRWH